jgi:hypothetical protein
MVKVSADTIHGVYYSDFEQDENTEYNEETFYDSLSTLKDGEVIDAIISDEMIEKIQREYGIS